MNDGQNRLGLIRCGSWLDPGRVSKSEEKRKGVRNRRRLRRIGTLGLEITI